MKETIVSSKSNIFNSFSLKELYEYRDLFFEFVKRDIKMRHKQTVLGVIWVIFQPLASMIIFTLIFGLVIKMPSDSLPYPLFIFIGLNYWNFFSNAVTSASGSLAASEGMIKKVYFPRIIIPLSSIATSLFDFIISTIFLIILSIIYRVSPHPLIFVFFPLVTIMVLLFSSGLGILLSSLNVRYHDVRQIIPFFIQILIFLTPVFYPTTIVSESNRWILYLNPLTPSIEFIRGLFIGQIQFNINAFLLSGLSSLIIFMLGLLVFSKMQKYFADII